MFATSAISGRLHAVALDTFSAFDTGNRPLGAELERFYHEFVLGPLVELRERLHVVSEKKARAASRGVLSSEHISTRSAMVAGWMQRAASCGFFRDAVADDASKSWAVSLEDMDPFFDEISKRRPAPIPDQAHAF